jgi:hypothetical protein
MTKIEIHDKILEKLLKAPGTTVYATEVIRLFSEMDTTEANALIREILSIGNTLFHPPPGKHTFILPVTHSRPFY